MSLFYFAGVAPMSAVEVRMNLRRFLLERTVTRRESSYTNWDMSLDFGMSTPGLIETVSRDFELLLCFLFYLLEIMEVRYIHK